MSDSVVRDVRMRGYVAYVLRTLARLVVRPPTMLHDNSNS